jgi:PAS domain S-box-containing protein
LSNQPEGSADHHDSPLRDPARKDQGRKTQDRKLWLLALLLFLVVLPLMAGTYWMYLQSKEEIAGEELQSDLLRARTLSAIVERDFISAENILTSIADRPEVKNGWAHGDLDSMKAHLEEALKLEPAFLFVGLFDLEGTSRALEPGDRVAGKNFAQRDWYAGVTAHWEPYVSEVYRTSAAPNPLVVAVAVPIRDANGKPTGILMGTYSLSELAGKFSVLEQGATSEYYVVDQHGVVAAAPGIDTESEPVHLPAPFGAARALAGQEGSEQIRIDGGNTFVGFSPVRRLGWAVVYSRSESAALAPAFHLRSKYRSVGLYLLLVYLATAALAAFLMRRQTQLLAANQVLNVQLEKRIVQGRLAREELDRYFTLSIDMLCIAGSDGYFKRVNPAWQRLLGHTTEELLASPRFDFVHPDDRQKTAEQIASLNQGLDTVSFENRYLCKDGSYKWLSWHATPFPEQQLIYAVARDITELKLTQEALLCAKEAAERSNKFKDQFLSTMSHELRTPLNAVVGFSDLLTEEHYGPLNDRQKRYVQHIQNGGRHLLRLINDILDLSKIEAGRLQLSIESVPVAETFSYVSDVLRSLADKQGHRLIQHPSPNLSVRADSTRFKQILMNLLGNAIKFTPHGGKIEMAAHQVGEFVRVDIRDSGPGIPPEERERVFEAFFRLGQQNNATEGTGLGLAITRRLVELQGGHLGIESQPGTGSCFFFTLPMVPTLHKSEHREDHSTRNSSGVPRILVVEDDPAAAHLLESQLISAGYEMILCDQPDRAVEMAAELQPSAVTLDIVMKPVSGWEVLRNFKADPRTAAIPVIIVTIVDEQAVGALLGADEYIVKPVDKDALLAAVERCMRRRRRTKQTDGWILLVEDDAPTREFVTELLSKQGYKVETAGNVGEACNQIANSLPELAILDLILPEVSGFQLLAEWRANSRTADLPIFILTSKDLTPQEQNYLRETTSALFRKQEPWQEALLRQLHRAVPPVPVVQT